MNDLRCVLPEWQFRRALYIERKRAERSGTGFVLMLLDLAGSAQGHEENQLDRTAPAILASVRETDIVGWCRQGHILGVIFAELASANKQSLLSTLRSRVMGGLRSTLIAEEAEAIHLTLACFPEDWNVDVPSPARNLSLAINANAR